jgi:glycosyltransferase involved in cell wall biosynthesis
MAMSNFTKSELPLVSIITPSFNSMPYLEENIKSVLSQNYPNFEHIIIDGGSSDGSINTLKSYSHLIWISEKDRGQSHAINKGFAKSKGDIIGWLNSDDTYNPGAIETAVQVFIDNPSVDLLFTDINIIDENGNIIGISRGDAFDLERILTFNMVKQPTIFMRRKVVDDLSGLNEDLHYVMDQELWLRAGINKFKFYYLKNTIFANFRLIQGTKSFESATSFRAEWHRVVLGCINHPSFTFISISRKKTIINRSITSIYISRMIKALIENKKGLLIGNFIKAISISPSLLLNMGIWKYLLFGILGLGYNKIYKYQKNLGTKFLFERTGF